MPVQRRLKEDKAYTHKQIERILKYADRRGQVMVLLMASTGMRIGALPQLTIGSLEKRQIPIFTKLLFIRVSQNSTIHSRLLSVLQPLVNI